MTMISTIPITLLGLSEKIKEAKRGEIQSWGTMQYRYFIKSLNDQVMILRVEAVKDWIWKLMLKNLEKELEKVFYRVYDFPVKIENYENYGSRTPRNLDVYKSYGSPAVLLLSIHGDILETLIKEREKHPEFFKI
jgi:hypothetical protein